MDADDDWEYDNKLSETLAKMREELEILLRQNHDKTDAFYQEKVYFDSLSLRL